MTEHIQSTATDYDVLVVGAGPTGLMAGCELLRRGVRVRIIDMALEPLEVPKALALWPRALDILEDMGAGPAIRAASTQINGFSYYSDRQHLATFDFPEDLAPRHLPQPETERALTARLHALGGKIERGVRLLGVEKVDYSGDISATDGVTAVLEHGDGMIERTRVPFLIGADGAGSKVRGELGSGFTGSTYEMEFALVDSRIEGHLPADQILYFQNPNGTLVIVPQPDGVFRFLSVMPRGGEGKVGTEMMQRILYDRGPRGVKLTEPVWETVFRVHARTATDFQRGRIFLMGDAAHVHSPAGGQGMNNGLQDAHNLAWKLAAVVQGRSPAALLDTYGPERSAATQRIVRDTDLQTRAWMFNGRVQVRARDAAFRVLDRTGIVSHFYAPVMAGRRLAYDIVRETQRPSRKAGCGLHEKLPGGLKVGAVFPRKLAVSHRISGPDADPEAWSLAVLPPSSGGSDWLTEIGHIVDRWPQVRVERLRRRNSVRATGCWRPGYYLVRPDGHIAAHGHDRDLNRLEAELAAALLPIGSR
ncbi:FAD-dependent monooxygenase [Streptomyces sp. NPDC101118]|uniref:FAD-dependent monooxygenase n=1 Tax=Streptomyces sp. NPDC101118 TaxID=3366109 RepID=UPI0037F462CB